MMMMMMVEWYCPIVEWTAQWIASSWIGWWDVRGTIRVSFSFDSCTLVPPLDFSHVDYYCYYHYYYCYYYHYYYSDDSDTIDTTLGVIGDRGMRWSIAQWNKWSRASSPHTTSFSACSNYHYCHCHHCHLWFQFGIGTNPTVTARSTRSKRRTCTGERTWNTRSCKSAVPSSSTACDSTVVHFSASSPSSHTASCTSALCGRGEVIGRGTVGACSWSSGGAMWEFSGTKNYQCWYFRHLPNCCY